MCRLPRLKSKAIPLKPMPVKTALFSEVYKGYAYSYPHKHAYRALEQPAMLRDVWDNENKKALFLYIHIPFCEMRCGFCNLFTIANPEEGAANAYLKQLQQQATVMKELLGDTAFGQIAVGGGTPTYLETDELEKLFHIIENTLGAVPKAVPFSFEMSPKTITAEKLALLKTKGVDRVSMGVQSFVETETKQLGRPQQTAGVYVALELLRETAFPVMNLDLIYGVPGQTTETWLFSIKEALRFSPEELFLYPLYVRPFTGMDKMQAEASALRQTFYRAGRDYLLEHGYEQVSMRMFRKKNTPSRSTIYRCQEDGMLGLGAGARSYTKALHYSSEYAVGRKGVREIISDYMKKTSADFGKADYGFYLDEAEQRRRYLIKSLLHGTGLDVLRYHNCFASDVLHDFPKVQQLLDEGYVKANGHEIIITQTGLEYADAIGPWLYSDAVNEYIAGFELR
jgi:oxygen-independent coproporphyrinogen III oxidase